MALKTKVFLLDAAHRGFGGINSLNEDLIGSSLRVDFDFHRSGLNEIWDFEDCVADDPCPVVFVFDEVMTWAKLPKICLLRKKVSYWAAQNGRSFSFILREHHYSEGFAKHCVRSKKKFYLLLRAAYSLMDSVIAISHAQADWMLRNDLCHKNKVKTFHQAINTDRFLDLNYPRFFEETLVDRKTQSGYLSDSFVFGAIGRFRFQKGFDQLLSAWECFKNRDDVKLLIAGEGEDRDRLHEISKSFHNVEFLGTVKDPERFYSRCDCVVVPSRYEPFGQVCLEARTAGRPTIVSSADGLPEQVGGNYGMIFEEGHTTELANRMREVFQLEATNYFELCREARKSAVLSWSHFLDEFQNVLRVM